MILADIGIGEIMMMNYNLMHCAYVTITFAPMHSMLISRRSYLSLSICPTRMLWH